MINKRRHSAFLLAALVAGGVLGWLGSMHASSSRLQELYKFQVLSTHMQQQGHYWAGHQRYQEAHGLRAMLREHGPEVLDRELTDRIEMHDLNVNLAKAWQTDEHLEVCDTARRELGTLLTP